MLYRLRPLMVVLVSSALASVAVFACSSEDEPVDDSGEGGTGPTAAGASSKGGGTAKGGTTGVGNGGTTSGKGGSTSGNGGSSTSMGNGGSSVGVGGSGVGGAVVPVAGNAGRASTGPQSSCKSGVDTGDPCNASIDTTTCVRSTRTCTCSAQTQQWTCTPNGVGGAGGDGSGGRGNNTAGRSGLAGSLGIAGFAGLPVLLNCTSGRACDIAGQLCDKSASSTPRMCTCTQNGADLEWDCVRL